MAGEVTWEGDPIFYRRTRGFGLVIRDLHYLFDASGRIERVSGVNDKVLALIVKQVYKDTELDPALQMLAYSETPGRHKARLETRKRTIPPARGAR